MAGTMRLGVAPRNDEAAPRRPAQPRRAREPKLLRMTDDDWAPLPEQQLCNRPGEGVDVAKRVIAVPPSPVPPAPVAAPRTAADEAVAERAIAALKAKIAAAPPAKSLVAEAQHREQRATRKHRAAASSELAALHVQGEDPTAKPVVEYAADADGRDEREESEWYRALPAKEQERLHGAWAGKREHAASSATGQRRIGNRRFVAALAVFAAALVLGTGAMWHATVGAAIACGFWWRHTRADRFNDPLRAVGCMFVMHAVAMLAHRTPNQVLWMDCIFVVAFAALVGFDGEMRRSGGFDVTR
jgi:hypothetical protein